MSKIIKVFMVNSYFIFNYLIEIYRNVYEKKCILTSVMKLNI